MTSKQKVLIVDDNTNNIRLAADTLKSLNVSIIFATSGFKAIDIVKEDSIDLILMDINMPEMDGFETVKKLNTNIPIIFVTALNDKDSILKAFREGGVDYITKPFYPEELIARVSTHLRLTQLNKNLSVEVDVKTQELQLSMSLDHSTGAFSVSKLYDDLAKSSNTVAAMIHIKGLQASQIAFGHDTMANVLSYFVKWINNNKEFNITLYKVASSDFICLFNITDIKEIKKICLNLQTQLESLDIELINGSTINLRSVITMAKGKQSNLLQRLRIAQEEVKNKNLSFYLFEKEGMEIIKEQEKNINQIGFLKKSFKDDTIVPFFQPIVETKTGKIVKYECLARIKDVDKIISPFFFIDAAKKLGSITRITKIMIEKSCKIFANTEMLFSINITKEDLMEEYLIKLLEDMTQKYHLSKSQITLEILEEISVFGNDKVVFELLQLKNEGYKIALDDFGSENASFSRMLDLKIDILKIDAMFIKNIHTHKNSRLIVESIAHMAKLFNYEIVAEYVHNKEVLDVLKDLGIKYSQGYYFSAPLEVPVLSLACK